MTLTKRSQPFRTSALFLLVLLFSSLCLPTHASGFLFSMPPNLVTLDSGQRNPIFTVGQPVTFALGGSAAVSYDVHDYYGNLVDQGSITRSSLTVRAYQPGWYKLNLYGSASQSPWGAVVGGTMFTIFRPNSNFPTLPPKGAFGGYDLEDEVVRGITGMGPQRHKVDDDNNPAAAIAKLNAEIAVDQQYYLPYDPLRKRAILVAFPNGTSNTAGVQQIVKHFQNVVTYWEGRNEPNSTSSGAGFVPEEQAFYQAVKSVNPNLKVVGPAVVTIGPFGLNWLNDFFAAGGGKYIDALSFHAYNNVNGDLFLTRQSLGSLQALLVQYGLGGIEKWQTEQGYMAACYGDYQPRLQGRWTMLQMMLFEQYGIPKEHNHLWYDLSGGFWQEPMFWENADGGVNPAAPLMRVWAEELYGTNYASAYDFGITGDKLYIGDLFTGPGKRIATFMSAGSTDGQVALEVTGGSSLHVVSAFGVAQDLPVVNGLVTLAVPEEPVYVEMTPGQNIQVIPLNLGTDIALASGVVPTASGTGQHPVDSSIANPISKIINGQYDTYYWTIQNADRPWMDNTHGFPAWVQLQFPTPQTIDHVVVYACPPWQWEGTLTDYELQYNNNGQWTTINHVQEPVNTFDLFSPSTNTTIDSYFSDRWIFQHQFPPVTTDKIRLFVHNCTYGGEANYDAAVAGGQAGPQNIALREIEVYNSAAAQSPSPTPAAANTFRIRSGGNAYTSATAGSWQADCGYTNGHPYTFPTAPSGTTDPQLFQSVRADAHGFSYRIPAAPGTYTLNLCFDEGDKTGPGQRLFNVSVNGTVVLPNFDVFAAAGGQGKALIESIPVTASGNGITVNFQTVYCNSMVSAISLAPSASSTGSPPTSPVGLTATAGNAQVGLTWSAVTGATSYNLYRATSAGGEGAAPYQSGLTSPGFTDVSVTNGQTYFYTVTAVNANGESAQSGEASAIPTAPASLPTTPVNLVAMAGNAQAGLSWNAVTGAASYNLYRATSAGGEGTTPYKTGLTNAAYTDTGLTNGTAYFYTVTAVNNAGQSQPSGEASATPAAPANSASATFIKSDISAQGNWRGIYGGDGYNVINDTAAYPAYAAVAGGFTTYSWAGATADPRALQRATTPASRIAACGYGSQLPLDVNLADGQTHQVTLYALDWDESGRDESIQVTDAVTGTVLNTQSLSGFTNGVYLVWNIKGHVKFTITVTGGPNAVISGLFFDPAGGGQRPPVPAAPTGLAATAGNAKVGLTWSAVTGATSYNLYRSTSAGGEGTTPYKTGLTTAAYTDTGLTPGTTLYYKVTAINSVGEGAPSGEASATPTAPPPPAPTGLAATAGNAQVGLSWNAVTGATSYNLYRATTAGSEGTTAVKTGLTTPSYTDTGLTNGQTYFYTVTAVNANGESAQSGEDSATPTAPTLSPPALQIRCGGGAYTSTTTGNWAADTDFTGGSNWNFRGTTSGTSDPALFQQIRFDPKGFSYNLPATPGTYTLNLYFEEGDKTRPGQRVFNVSVNGTVVLPNFDVFAAAGGQGKALIESIPVTVPPGANSVNVSFQTVVTNAIVSAIQLVPGKTNP